MNFVSQQPAERSWSLCRVWYGRKVPIKGSSVKVEGSSKRSQRKGFQEKFQYKDSMYSLMVPVGVAPVEGVQQR